MSFSRTLIPDLVVLQAFECAARHGNFTKAAAELHLTQSAISRQIGLLEDQLGVLLFERIRKRVILSAAGRKLLPEAARLLQSSEEMVRRARAAPEGGAVLSIATLPTFGARWLLPRLPDFVARHPGVVVDIVSRSQPFDFETEAVELAIHYGQPVWAKASCAYLFGEIIIPVASPALIDASAILAPVDLTDRSLLHLTTRPKLWSEWFDLNGLPWDTGFRGHRFDQFSMIIEAALKGMGFALLPLYLIEEELSSGTLRIALDRPMSTESAYYAVAPEAGTGSPQARAFQAWLLSKVGRH